MKFSFLLAALFKVFKDLGHVATETAADKPARVLLSLKVTDHVNRSEYSEP